MGPADLFGFLLVFCLSLHGLEGADVWTIEGDSPVLPCGITYDPNVNLFWTLQPENIILLLKHPDGRVEVLEDPFKGRVDFVDRKNLKIRNVSRLDDSSVWGGEYRCSQGSRAGERTHLHVRHPPSRVAITGYNSSTTLQPGDELQLSCDADDSNPAPSYAWYKNGIKIGEGRTVNINPVKLENNGDVIRCKVTVHDDREPVFHWEGQRQVRLSVRATGRSWLASTRHHRSLEK
ncbi:PREDICTED: cell adhesion molecule 2-like [Branchiostoma belcheri]|uniref:Cell adhesion molecule 2-like n=1 Tax=Branchiostoma belcheri TaxID=7741 RepID=A0A6P4YVN6_BRABE|nr:PREDICTED: cell adhesion molecule 2-like [Branchiostoma belcheri]